jgi:hypothetical protein
MVWVKSDEISKKVLRRNRSLFTTLQFKPAYFQWRRRQCPVSGVSAGLVTPAQHPNLTFRGSLSWLCLQVPPQDPPSTSFFSSGFNFS